MKICKTCKTHYVDDTLNYCLQEGTVLTSVPDSETPTVVFGEPEDLAPGRGWEPTQVTRIPSVQPEARKSNTVLIVLLTALGMLVIFAVVAWIYLKEGQGNTIKNDNSNSNPKITSTAAPAPAKTDARPVNNTVPPPAVDPEEARRDIEKTIMTWKSMAESRDLDSYMGNYAGTVDYYRKKGASRAYVRDDKRKYFENYTSIRSDITNMDITISPSGGEATVLFDKEWDSEGAKRSTGKLRQELKLRNVNNEWLITSEKEIKVYYKN